MCLKHAGARTYFRKETMRDNSTCHIKDLTGRKFGRLLVTKADGLYISSGHIKAMWWWCKCSCGSIVSVRGNRLTCGITRSCGCWQKELAKRLGTKNGKASFVDRIGQRYGRLLVISRSSRTPQTNGVYWNCLCKCGRKTVVASSNLGMGSVRSCGCLLMETSARIGREQRGRKCTPAQIRAMVKRLTKHGHAVHTKHTRTYISWGNMMQRAGNHNRCAPEYANVHVCKRWHKFGNFLADMGTRPAGTSLSRLADSGDYKPGNVVWGTRAHQAEQKRLKTQRRIQNERRNN